MWVVGEKGKKKAREKNKLRAWWGQKEKKKRGRENILPQHKRTKE